MAIAKLNKIRILIHRLEKETLFEFLQAQGEAQIIDLTTHRTEEAYSLLLAPEDESLKIKSLEKTQQDLLCFIDIMSLVNKTKRYTVTKNEFKKISENFQYHELLEKAKVLEASLKKVDFESAAIAEKRQKLLPWQSLDADLADICKTSHTEKGLGRINRLSLGKIEEETLKSGSDVWITPVAEEDNSALVLFIYIKNDERIIEPIFKKYGLERVYITECKGSPAKLLALSEARLRQIEKQKSGLLEELSTLAKLKKEIMVLMDNAFNLNRKETAEKGLLRTEAVYVIEGWIKKSSAGLLKKRIEEKFLEAELFFEEPKPGDNVPVALENMKFLQPFEAITKIYGMPAYNEVDPTPFLAPFFFVFFGFCVTDAGYGLALALFSFFVLKKFRLGWMASRLFRLFLYGGISAIILGAITGGWFGNLIDILAEKNNAFLTLKNLKDSIILLDPLKEPLKLLIIALGLGIIQIWFGHMVAIYGNIKNRRYLDAVYDQGSMLVFLSGFTGLILVLLNAIPAKLNSAFALTAMAGAAAIVLTAGRANPTLGSKLFQGIFVLYNTFSGYISDILSYSRLWALGLVTGVMAMTCNLIAVIMGRTVPFVGFLFTILILIGGHLFTLVINLLGAFIHPMRLQFVEFFSKFFKGGGREFKPFRLENKYTIVE